MLSAFTANFCWSPLDAANYFSLLEGVMVGNHTWNGCEPYMENA